jgi:hypothetical protein
VRLLLHRRVRSLAGPSPGPWVYDSRSSAASGATAATAGAAAAAEAPPLEADTGCGELPEGLELVVKLMVPGELALATCTPHYAYEVSAAHRLWCFPLLALTHSDVGWLYPAARSTKGRVARQYPVKHACANLSRSDAMDALTCPCATPRCVSSGTTHPCNCALALSTLCALSHKHLPYHTPSIRHADVRPASSRGHQCG